VILIAAFSLVLAGASQRPTYRVNWPALEAALSEYLSAPSSETAGKIAGLLPAGSDVDRSRQGFDVESSHRIFDRLTRLEPLVLEGRTDAITVSFALTEISDGHFAETLLEMLASSIDKNAGGFLRALRANRGRTFASCELAEDTPAEMYDDARAIRKTLESRLVAVQWVKDPDCATERSCVIDVLRKALRQMDESSNNRLKLSARGRSAADARLRTRAAA